ncbi:MAG: carboxypeptidase-like regulatory domain-containing protein, partial [Rikenellaceae bacterium]
MRKIKMFFMIAFAIIHFGTFAQDANTVCGRVIDKETKESLAFTTITLTKYDSENKRSETITRENGLFIFEDVSKGQYTLKVQFLGYKPYVKKILLGSLNNNFDLGKIELETEALAIQEVSVMGNRSTVAAALDKKIFDISNNISQTGGSVLEAMRNLPGVTVD